MFEDIEDKYRKMKRQKVAYLINLQMIILLIGLLPLILLSASIFLSLPSNVISLLSSTSKIKILEMMYVFMWMSTILVSALFVISAMDVYEKEKKEYEEFLNKFKKVEKKYKREMSRITSYF